MKFKRACFIFFVIMAVSTYAQIDILESTPSKCTFSWNIGKFDILPGTAHGEPFVEVSFDEANITLGEGGEPVIPAYSMFLGIPQDGSISVTFSPEEIKTVNLLEPVFRHEKSNRIRQPGIKFSTPWISDPIYKTLNNFRAAHLIIRPFLYDELTKSVKVVTKGTCTVLFPGAIRRSVFNEPVGDYERMVSGLLHNYEVAKGWRIMRPLSKRTEKPFPFKPDHKIYTFKIGDGHSGTNETTTKENGIVLIPGSRIIDSLGPVQISKVVLYASNKGPLSSAISDDGNIPDGIQEVPLLRIDKNGNGIVDKNDYFLAYISALSDWKYEPQKGDYSFVLDSYDDSRNYWLSVSSEPGLTVVDFKSISGHGDTLNTTENKILFKRSESRPFVREKDAFVQAEGSLSWVWTTLTRSNIQFEHQLDLPGLDTNVAGIIKIYSKMFNTSASISVGTGLLQSLYGETDDYKVNSWGNRKLRIQTNPLDSDPRIEIIQFEVKYNKILSADDSVRMEAFSPVGAGIFYYKMKVKTDALVYIFRISSDEKNVSLVDTLRGTANQTYTWSDSGGKGTRYFICSEKELDTLPAMQKLSYKSGNSEFLVHDIRATTDSCDFLIITHIDFLSAAQKFASHKKKIGFKAPRIVDIQNIYNLFSGGNVDPVALRNFIFYVRRNWGYGDALSYVVTIGNGHYDYKCIKTSIPVFIPVYYDKDQLFEGFYTASDALTIGRFPCQTLNEASAIVDKIITSEDPSVADFSDWRNRAVFIADDDMQGTTPDPIFGKKDGHHVSSDKIAETIESKMPSMILHKKYLFEYKWNGALEKPEASQALINEINNGVGYVNYFGHGDHDVWADERIFDLKKLSKLNNYGKYPLISSFSCSVGKFDEPNVECLSGALVTLKNAGAIATISSTRKSGASSNEYLAKNFYEALFDTTTVLSIGLAFAKAQFKSNSSSNGIYALFGDPSMCFINPQFSIDLNIGDIEGNSLDTLMALQRVTVSGSIVDKYGNIKSDFGTVASPASIHLGIFNPEIITSRKDGGTGARPKPEKGGIQIFDTVSYKLPGSPAFLGKTAVKNGCFSQTFVVPQNVTFDKHGVKLTAYAWKNGSKDFAIGSKKDILFHGTNAAALDDTTGPRITIRPLYEFQSTTGNITFTGRKIAVDSLKCEIGYHDESGIDIIGTGPDDGLSIEVEGAVMKQNINHKFLFIEGDYRSGTAIIKETGLRPGYYTLNLTARDLLGNLSKVSFDLEITQFNEIMLDNVFNYPNPMRMGKCTKFYFFPSNTYYKSTAAIKIYSLSGRPLRVIKNAKNGEVWDGRDQIGNVLSPDVYLYQIIATSPDLKKSTKSKVKKLVIHPPR